MTAERIFTVESAGDNVFVNQGIEAALFDRMKDGEAALYLWRNANAVVIGRNQDAYAECRVDALESDGGLLARRLSGGGAVWHDEGNLNFTFLAREKEADKDKNFRIVLSALSALGINAELGGRNDLYLNGAKSGGNAYFRRGGTVLHHGTLLVTTRRDAVARYLTPSEEKLESKAVKSVAARVAPLSDVLPDITVDAVSAALKAAFEAAYPGAEKRALSPVELGAAEVIEKTGMFASDEWRYGRRGKYNVRVKTELFGESAVLKARVVGGVTEEAEVFSDSLDADAVVAVNAALSGGDAPASAREQADRLLGELKNV